MKKLPLLLTAAILLLGVQPASAIFISDTFGDLYDLDVSTNTSTLIGNNGLGVDFIDIALDPISGILYGTTSGALLASIDTTTGVGTVIGSTLFGMTGLTFDSSGTLFGSGATSLYTVNTTTGAGTVVGDTGYLSSGDLAFDSSGNLFMSAKGLGDQLISLNSTTGAGTLIGPIGWSGVFGLNFADSTLYGFAGGGWTLTIDTSTGAYTSFVSNGIFSTGAEGSVGGVESVPDTGTTLALLGLALAGLVALRRRFG